MSKIRTFSMVSTITAPQVGSNAFALIYKDPAKYGGNLLKLKDGVNQRWKVLPKDLSLTGNKKLIGTYQPNLVNEQNTNNWLDQRMDFSTRSVKIFLLNTSRMHNVPVLPHGDKWCVQYERMGVYKTPAMGWTYVNDTMSKRLVKFKTLQDAINYCKGMGIGFEIEYPHFRYHTRKNYGDNFKWKGNPKPELEDI